MSDVSSIRAPHNKPAGLGVGCDTPVDLVADYTGSANAKKSDKNVGRVSLVGAGPGDPELLTVKALRAIESADLILFDHLIGPQIKSLFPTAVPAFYVGKRKGEHSIAQQDLNSLLVHKAKDGMHIVRLKGGDPFVFGRGGEELLALAAHGIDVDIVPGITAAAGCAASTKIPLTHRGLAQGCTFVTGFAEHDLRLNWQALAELKHTLVFYMGLTRVRDIQHNLCESGMSENTPVAIIENGSRDDERLLICELAGLEKTVVDNAVTSPALIVVGDVVTLAPTQALDLYASLQISGDKCA